MKKMLLTSIVLSAGILSLQSCSSGTKPETPAAQTSSTETVKQTEAPKEEFIEIDSYRFKLSPDVQTDGVAHLDFYVHDKSDKHLKGVTGTFVITKPDGTKVELPIAEEEPNDHYHGMVKLDQTGDYLIVAQVTIEGKKLNPRFSFTRKL
ncbi:MAG TPA: hypothetical protein EYN91_10640 [Candidatus Melainabacteria bacterium]|nr:hypothetical protein [Candidatus Obscuribacterales bacterium]HIA52530.1 hypothetical protein [Candidatus Melainabacteria bacterium]HIN64066.1 hypothetical protein [Candidatus Obscuribacterales bacterium]